MPRTIFLATALLTATLLAITMHLGAQSASEAPAGFDAQTNGTASQSAMDTAAAVFSEIETPERGLGPIFNATSCADCHQNMAVGGGAQTTVLRAGHVSRGEHSRDNYLHDSKRRSDTNGSSGTFTAATAVLTNGDTIPDRSLINQRAICADAQAHVTAAENISTPRLSLSVLGDAFVEAVPDATFLALAKQNGGEAIMVPVLESPNTSEVGRFGWKNQHASLFSFAGDAYFNEMGITNELFPEEATTACEPAGVPHPNDVDHDLVNLTLFMRATKVPPRGPITAQVNQGQAIFESIGCATCHVSTLVTAPAGTTMHGGAYLVPAALGSKQFHPFGDFLLHDIGTGDGIQQNGPADTAYKIRTAPLWGLRTRTQLLHDASAMTLEQAIQKHTHEAATEAQKFSQLSPAQKQLLNVFLNSL
ncbi:MAG TPA: di-heme oxidoredictase family protein [Candidatus Acidoferrales bacterium]|nr:di-heme oxidoredictase family protein [Candidatus Acidoferrales bacterium]